MRSIESWLSEYGESHTDSTNKAIHWICVPSIMFSILGLLSMVTLEPLGMTLEFAGYNWLSLGSVLILGAMIFYLMQSFTLAFGMIVITGTMLALIVMISNISPINPLWVYIGVFVIAWIGQFIGHKIEGKKPSFLKDLAFLLIGPDWLLSFVYKNLGIKY